MLEHATGPAPHAGRRQGRLGLPDEDYLALVALGGGVCLGVIGVGMLLLIAFGVLPR